MYAWYGAAQVCYAYVDDVDHISEMQRSRWFTRGWTLQELIAPPQLRFYGRNWVLLDTRLALADLLVSITGITREVLDWSPPFETMADLGGSIPDRVLVKSVAARMSWAASRQTTRVEDQAYCLLGLFNVNMPLLYGEGQKAFLRLQEEIAKILDDESLFAWPTLIPDQEALVARTIPGFIGYFAPSPLYFAKSGSIIPIPGRIRQRPWVSTNKGLQINLPIMKLLDLIPPLYREKEMKIRKSTLEDEIYYGLLNCQFEDDPTTCLGIVLQGGDLGHVHRLIEGYIRHGSYGADADGMDWKNPFVSLKKISSERASTAKHHDLTIIARSTLHSRASSISIVIHPAPLLERGFVIPTNTCLSSNSTFLLRLNCNGTHPPIEFKRQDKPSQLVLNVSWRRGRLLAQVFWSREAEPVEPLQQDTETSSNTDIFDLDILPTLTLQTHFDKPLAILNFTIRDKGDPREKKSGRARIKIESKLYIVP